MYICMHTRTCIYVYKISMVALMSSCCRRHLFICKCIALAINLNLRYSNSVFLI